MHRTCKVLSLVEQHQILAVMDEACNHHAHMEQLVAMPAHIKGAWLATLWDFGYVE